MENCLKLLTFLPLPEIAQYHFEDQRINEAKKRLAFEVTAIVHDREAAQIAHDQAAALFDGAGRSDTMPTATVATADVTAGLPLLDVLLQAGVIPSKGEGRRLVTQGGLYLNGTALSDPHVLLRLDDFSHGEAIVRKGKKVYHRLLLS